MLKGLMLEQLGIPSDLPGFKLTPDGSLSPSLTWAMRVLAMTTEELEWMKAQKAATHAELEIQLPGELVSAGLDTIVGVCEDVLHKYPTTEDEDTKRLEDLKAYPQESPMRAVIALRRGEKRILQATIRTAKRKLGEMTFPGQAKKADL